MRNLSTPGIILKKHNRGEYDQVITFFSPILGKIQATTKGSKKIDSVFTGHIEILNICKFQLYKNNQSYTITQCVNINNFAKLRNDLGKTTLALLIIEIFEKSILGEDNAQILYELLTTTIEQLSVSKQNFLCAENFKIKLLHHLGILPEISRCSKCNKRWQSNQQIWLDDGIQFKCFGCLNNRNQSLNVPFNIIKLINFLKNSQSDNEILIKIGKREMDQLKTINNIFLQNYLNQEIKTEKILQKI